MSDLVERLRATYPHQTDPISLQPKRRNPDGPEAAAEIERLRAALERVQNAPMVIEGGSVQWCRNVATKALARQALKGPTDE